MDLFTGVWIAWLILGGGVELLALALRKPGLTLSEHVWAWFHVKDGRHGPVVWAVRASLLIGLIWLTGHLGFGWWSL